MNYPLINEPKKWNSECPDCGSVIRWSLTSGKKSSKGVAHCSNNMVASRIDCGNLRDVNFCFWEGHVVRQNDGGVRFKNKDGNWIRELR